jgi:hypothetical protein
MNSLAGNLLDPHVEGPDPGRRAMREERKSPNCALDEIIAAFDREREQAQDLHRQHCELVRSSRTNDQPIAQDRGRSRSQH